MFRFREANHFELADSFFPQKKKNWPTLFASLFLSRKILPLWWFLLFFARRQYGVDSQNDSAKIQIWWMNEQVAACRH